MKERPSEIPVSKWRTMTNQEREELGLNAVPKKKSKKQGGPSRYIPVSQAPYVPRKAEVVTGAEFSAFLKEWAKRYRKHQPVKEHNDQYRAKRVMGKNEVPMVGPVGYIVAHTGFDERKVRSFLDGEFDHVDYYKWVEPILVAIDEQDAVYHGELHIIPNPNWSQETWIKYMEARGCI